MRKNLFVGLRCWKGVIGFTIFTFLIFSYSFCGAVSVKKTGEDNPAVMYDVVSSAQITKVSYYLDKFKGRETVHFEVGVKNISSEPKRFKLKVFISDGPGAAYYYPRKGKPPVLKPGESYMKPLPMVFFDRLPTGFTIKVEEM